MDVPMYFDAPFPDGRLRNFLRKYLDSYQHNSNRRQVAKWIRTERDYGDRYRVRIAGIAEYYTCWCSIIARNLVECCRRETWLPPNVL